MVKQRKTSTLFAKFVAFLVPLTIASGARAADSVPPPWQSVDVGEVGLAGSARVGPDGDLFIDGAGSNIWGTADSFHFMYQPIGDGEISSNLPSQSATDPFAKIGLMIRMSLDPGSPHVILDVKPDGTFEFMTRSMQDGETTFIAGGAFRGRVRLIRNSGVVTAAFCPNDDTPCQTLGSTPFPGGMALAGAVVTSRDPSTLNHGFFPASPPTVFTVPRPWFSMDIGAVGLAGDAFSDSGIFTVRGAGADIWNTSDSFHLVRNFITADGEIVARVTSEQAADPFAKAGVAISSSPVGSPSAATVILDIRPDGNIEFMARPSDGAPMAFLAGATSSIPVWLKLTRIGDQFTGFISPDGSHWQVVGMTTVTMPRNYGITAGLAVTSHDISALNTSTFDHVLVATSVGFGHDDVGDVGIAGELQISRSGLFTLQGGGDNIWGTTDAFTYIYQSLMGDGQMLVRINSLENTDTFAKAGVMIRESLDPSAAHVAVNVTPSSLVEVLHRGSTGADTQWIGGLSPTQFPIWLRLTRTGNVIDAWASRDGSAWMHLTQSFTTLPSDVLIGVAVSSHIRGTLTTATLVMPSR